MKSLHEIQAPWPTGVLYAASLWLSNSSYLHLSVSFIQMTKSLMPGLVYATGIVLGTEQFSRANAANMMLIAFGVVVCAIGEVNLVLKGVVQQLAALLFEVRSCHQVQANLCLDTISLCTLAYYVDSSSSFFNAQVEILEVSDVQAARLTLVQILINSKGLQMNPIQSLYYVSPACLMCLSIPFGGFPVLQSRPQGILAMKLSRQAMRFLKA
jgi:EamA domain-containing membrane protein RarD